MYDTSVDVSDSLQGNLGTVTLADSPATFTYHRTVGPYTTADCGQVLVPNAATITSHGSGVLLGQSNANVTVTVDGAACHPPPPAGCTLTIGFWKTHAGFGPQADVVTPLLPKLLGTSGGTKTQNVTTAALAVQFLSFNGSNNVFSASNGINKLYAQLLGAKLNFASGADGSAVAATVAAADAFLATHDSTAWNGLTKVQKAQVLAWMDGLDQYNNGLVGPGHCS